jgi:3-hydroxyacyl-CoA dehydrogenase
MGSGIATAILLSGGEVVLKELNPTFLDGAVKRIQSAPLLVH